MTNKTHRSGPGDEDARLEELLRADAATVADDDLFDDNIADENGLEGSDAIAPRPRRAARQPSAG